MPGKTPKNQAAIVYQLKRSLAELPESLRLRNHEWGALFAVTGQHSCAQIGTLLGLEAEERDRTFERLHSFGLIEERPLSYGEYLRAVASGRDEEAKSLGAFLRGGQAMPRARSAMAPADSAGPSGGTPRLPNTPGVVSPPVPAISRTAPPPSPPPVLTADSDLNITRALPTYDRQKLIEATVEAALSPAFLPLETPAVGSATRGSAARGTAVLGRNALSLKALMQFILGKASDVQTGQLDIYRVFIRINTKLLQRNGITTLRFEEDRLIEDPELQSAIATSVEKALGMTCPPEVFV